MWCEDDESPLSVPLLSSSLLSYSPLPLPIPLSLSLPLSLSEYLSDSLLDELEEDEDEDEDDGTELSRDEYVL